MTKARLFEKLVLAFSLAVCYTVKKSFREDKMKIYDISQELLTSCVFPGDPAPSRKVLAAIGQGDSCNLSALSLCLHNGTHLDAPYHFFDDGKTVDALSLEKCVGYCYVAAFEGVLSANDARGLLRIARARFPEAAKRILLKGNAVVSLEAAEAFAESGVWLVGNESQSVGPIDAPLAVHRALLSREVVLLEGIRLSEVENGVYFLAAQPLSVKGADGAPCRAILMDL